MRKFIGIDIGGTSIKFSVIEEDLKIIEKGKIDTRKSEKENFILEDIDKIIEGFLKKHKIDKIGISTAGVVDSIKGEIVYAGKTIPGYAGTKIKRELEEKYKLEVQVENDVNAAALGEVSIGAGRDSKSTFMITIGTGIGGAFLIEDKIFYGNNNSAGEVGYMKIQGRDIQDIASTTALVKNTSFRLKKKVDGREIFDLAEQGNKICIEEIDKILRYIAELIVTIIYTINPETIILGGGIMERKDYIGNKINEYVKGLIPLRFYEGTKIKFAKLGNEAGVIGAISKFI